MIAAVVFFAVQVGLTLGAVTLFGGRVQSTTPAELFGSYQGIALAIKMLVTVVPSKLVVKLIERRSLGRRAATQGRS